MRDTMKPFKKIYTRLFSYAMIVLLSVCSHVYTAEVTISHYFSSDLGQAALTDIFARYEKEFNVKIKPDPIGHEDFKAGILVRAAGNSLPDVFSYWAGARTQFVVDAGALHSIDRLWKEKRLARVVVKSVAASATLYNGKRYFIPFNYHYAGMFYNKNVLNKAGIKRTPKTWKGFKTMLGNLKRQGITPIALGSKFRWPGQFWFDYLLLRTAGPAYRAKLMNGEASYTDQEVVTAMKFWKELVDEGYFLPNANAMTWTDAADAVANGDAAMTLMGTWITGYWKGNGLKSISDYDFFEFPVMKGNVKKAVVGPVDGWLIAKNSKNLQEAEAFVSYMVSNASTSAEWATNYGAISPNVNVDTKRYDPIIKRALNVIKKADVYAFNYDLATTPPVAELGLSMFAKFMDSPGDYMDHLEETQRGAAAEFSQN